MFQRHNPSFPEQSLRPKNELFEFVKAWGGTTLAFAIAEWSRRTLPIIEALIIMGIAAGLGIVLHELAHRVVARRFGSEAHFIANDGMLVISVLVALSGFLFAAPGAVWHRGYLTKKQVGLIAAAGLGDFVFTADSSRQTIADQIFVFRGCVWLFPQCVAGHFQHDSLRTN